MHYVMHTMLQQGYAHEKKHFLSLRMLFCICIHTDEAGGARICLG